MNDIVEMPLAEILQRIVFEDQFEMAYHAKRGDSDVVITPWKSQGNKGRFRELNMISPVNSAFLKSTKLVQHQRLVCFKGGQKFLWFHNNWPVDVPWSSSFRVMSKADFMADPQNPNFTRVLVHISVYFLQSTIFKWKIEDTVLKDYGGAMRLYVDMMKKLGSQIKKPIPNALSAAAISSQPNLDHQTSSSALKGDPSTSIINGTSANMNQEIGVTNVNGAYSLIEKKSVSSSAVGSMIGDSSLLDATWPMLSMKLEIPLYLALLLFFMLLFWIVLWPFGTTTSAGMSSSERSSAEFRSLQTINKILAKSFGKSSSANQTEQLLYSILAEMISMKQEFLHSHLYHQQMMPFQLQLLGYATFLLVLVLIYKFVSK